MITKKENIEEKPQPKQKDVNISTRLRIWNVEKEKYDVVQYDDISIFSSNKEITTITIYSEEDKKTYSRDLYFLDFDFIQDTIFIYIARKGDLLK